MWQTLGHERVYQQFQRAVERNRLSGSYLFIGPQGVGKRSFALELAKGLLCLRNGGRSLDACGNCASCREITQNSHPDFEYICKPEERALMPLEFLIGPPERRNSTGLCHFLSVAPQFSSRKAAILDDADFLNAECANALLKTLEEPAPNAVIILLGTSAAKQLPTIRSRCRIVRFDALPLSLVSQLLLDKKIVESEEEAQLFGQASRGSLTVASDWARPGFWEFRGQILDLLSRFPFAAYEFSKIIADFSEKAGKEAKEIAGAKRAAIHCAQTVVLEFFTQLNYGLCAGNRQNGDVEPQMQQALERMKENWKWSSDVVGLTIERTLQFEEELYRNVHSGILIDSWANDLAAAVNYGRLRPIRL